MTGPGLRRYVSAEEDSARWAGFAHRAGDIVISTRSKAGTTWVQAICALLVFQSPELPAPLGELSPWLDWTGAPREEVFARLASQSHRRFVKTHTPLDGLPLDPRVTYVVVARHPLDAAVSLYHQGANLDRARLHRLTGAPLPDPAVPRPAPRDWLLRWIDRDADPLTDLDSLPGVLWHLSDAWARRDPRSVVLVHYADLLADLPGQMRRLADRLGIPVDEERWPGLVAAARFDAMRLRADRLAPGGGVLVDPDRFFRRGGSGAGRSLLTDEELANYLDRAQRLAPADLLAWLHR